MHSLLIAVTGDGAGWSTTRPRAKAEPRLEQWAGARLGDPASVVVHVATDGTRTMLDAAGLAALDIIYDSADPARLEGILRAALPTIPQNDALTSKRDPAWPPGFRAVHEVIELGRSLQAVLVQSRPAIPQDFCRPSDQSTRSVDAADLSLLKARAATARGGLGASTAAVQAALTPPGGAAISNAALAAALHELAAYGFAAPAVTGTTLVSVAQLAVGEAQRRMAAADSFLSGTFDAKAATDVGQAIFGDGFWMLPLISPPAEGDPLTRAFASGAIAPAGGAIRRFLRDTASVRCAVARYAVTMLLGDSFDLRTDFVVGQIADAADTGASKWAGGRFDPTEASPQRPVSDLVFEGAIDL